MYFIAERSDHKPKKKKSRVRVAAQSATVSPRAAQSQMLFLYSFAQYSKNPGYATDVYVCTVRRKSSPTAWICLSNLSTGIYRNVGRIFMNSTGILASAVRCLSK